MALVGHISGSSQSQSVIGVTGSVVFSNSTTFPSLSGVGSDVVFFVSGTVGGKNVSDQKTVAVFGGDAVVSGSLTVGTGSIKITSNDIQFGSNANRIELNGSDLKFFDSANPTGFTLASLGSGGGGGGASFFSSVTAGEAFTTGSLVSSGSYTVKDASGVGVIVLGTNGGITGSEAVLSGDLAVNGGDLTTSATTFNLVTSATTINIGDTAAAVNVGQSGTSNSLNVKGSLVVSGTSALTGNVTLVGNNQTVTHTGTGDLTISSGGSVLIEGSTFTGNNLTVPGDLTVKGAVVSIETVNLRVKDPLLLLNSGTLTSSSKSAIAFASGSTNANESLIFGVFGSSNVLAAARLDTRDGASDSSLIGYTNLTPIRASEFQASGDGARVTSPNGIDLTVTSSMTTIGANSDVRFAHGGATLGTTNATNGFTMGSMPGVDLNISGSNNFRIKHASPGIDIQRHGTSYLSINSGSHPSSTNAALIVVPSSPLTVNTGMLVGASGVTIVSGSQVIANAGGSGFTVQRNGSAIFAASSPDGTTTNLVGGSTTNVASLFNGSPVTTVNLGGEATTLSIGSITTSTQTINIGNASTGSSTYNFAAAATGNGFTRTINVGTGGTAGSTTNINLGNANGGTVTVNNNFTVNGNTTVGNADTDTVTFTAKANSSLLPSVDTTYDLGSPQFRWANMYTGDLHLKNDRGDWTIIEEPDFLTITNNRNGKRYKFVMEEIG